MRRPLHYLLLQPAPVTHKPQHSHESSGPQDHHPSFYLSIPASIHLYSALYNPLYLSLHIPASPSFKLPSIPLLPVSGTCTTQAATLLLPNFYFNLTCSRLSLHIWPSIFLLHLSSLLDPFLPSLSPPVNLFTAPHEQEGY